ncbi:MAG: energy-coupling factor ABC transporter ATP-binding protein [Gloeomargaritaceae cyanobacterium C42_A2020_066]|nr:energy-coupling factor ABC transporter ATP-binding protein [Gloeomargaritaceae cyanobacterium C42_A2020_066]
MLHLRHLAYHPLATSQPILRDIELTLAPHQLGLVVGPSGSGKSTLLELVAGLAQPSQGAIYWQNNRLTAPELQQVAGLVFQFPERHFCGGTVVEELRLGHPELRPDQIKEALAAVHLQQVGLYQAPQALSGGQQRRLALAVQLIRKPYLLLLDEPMAGLDWSMRRQLVNLLAELKQDWTLLIVSHDTRELGSIADHIWQMTAGRLVSCPRQAVEV